MTPTGVASLAMSRNAVALEQPILACLREHGRMIASQALAQLKRDGRVSDRLTPSDANAAMRSLEANGLVRGSPGWGYEPTDG